MKTKTKGIITAAMALVIIGAALSSDTKVESIELSIPDYHLEYDLNTEIPITVSVSPKDVKADSLEYISDDDSITFSSSGISTGNKEGFYKVYVALGDVKSDTVIINVVDMTAREELAKAEAEKEAEEKASKEAEEKAAKEAEEKAAKEAEKKAAKEAEEKASKEAEEKAAREAEEKASKEAKEKASNASADQVPKSSDSQGSGGNTNGHDTATPTDTASSNGGENNFNTYDNTEQQNTEAAYVLNTSSKKIHHPSCRSVPKIAPENYSTSNLSVDELINQGYSTCGICFK